MRAEKRREKNCHIPLGPQLPPPEPQARWVTGRGEAQGTPHPTTQPRVMAQGLTKSTRSPKGQCAGCTISPGDCNSSLRALPTPPTPILPRAAGGDLPKIPICSCHSAGPGETSKVLRVFGGKAEGTLTPGVQVPVSPQLRPCHSPAQTLPWFLMAKCQWSNYTN